MERSVRSGQCFLLAAKSGQCHLVKFAQSLGMAIANQVDANGLRVAVRRQHEDAKSAHEFSLSVIFGGVQTPTSRKVMDSQGLCTGSSRRCRKVRKSLPWPRYR